MRLCYNYGIVAIAVIINTTYSHTYADSDVTAAMATNYF